MAIMEQCLTSVLQKKLVPIVNISMRTHTIGSLKNIQLPGEWGKGNARDK